MALFDRSGGARVTVTPDVVRPRQSVTATAMVGKPIDKVTSARLEWGYDNFYRYHWAGRADSAAAAANSACLRPEATTSSVASKTLRPSSALAQAQPDSW